MIRAADHLPAPTLPNGWFVQRLGDLVDLVNGHPFSSDDFAPDGDIPLVRIRDLTADEFEVYVPRGTVPRRAVLEPGDVVVGMDGDFNAVIWDRGPAALNQRLCKLRPRAGTDHRFIAYALPALLKVVNDLTFSTTVKHLSSSDILGQRLPAPSIDEQRRIADFLDTETARLDTLTDLRRKEIGLLRTRRSVVVRDLVVRQTHGERLPSTLPWIESLPSHWRVVPLKYVARYGSGHTPSRTHPEYWVDCDIPWISLFDVGRMRDPRQIHMCETEQQVSRLGLANSSAVVHPAETVVLSRTASVGFATIMGVDMAVSQHFATWTCGSRLRPPYLLHLLRAMAPLFDSLKVGTTNVTVFMPDLLALRVPLPPLDEQDAIAAQIGESTTEIDRFLDVTERQVELLTERRQALITAAVTGQFGVTTARSVDAQ